MLAGALGYEFVSAVLDHTIATVLDDTVTRYVTVYMKTCHMTAQPFLVETMTRRVYFLVFR